MSPDPTELDYYRSHSPVTDPGPYKSFFEGAPSDLADLTGWVRNVVFHEGYLVAMDVTPLPEAVSPPEASDVVTRTMKAMLDRITGRDGRPLSEPRPKHHCLIGTCRDYAVFLTALLRHQGRPARPRCGFASYFDPAAPFAFDHWVAEVWDPALARWCLVDAEVDPSIPAHRDITLNPLDLPRDAFLVAGTAWQNCRQGRATTSDFGVWGLGPKDWWFLAGSVIRDLAALNKREMTVFDYWDLSQTIAERGSLSEGDFALIDKLAAATVPEAFNFVELQHLYETTPGLQVSSPVVCWPQGNEIQMEIHCA